MGPLKFSSLKSPYLIFIIEQSLFLMEAVWTRFFPLSTYIRQHISSGALGPIHRVIADNSVAASAALSTTWSSGESRMVAPSLGGGALLDLGIYSITWLFQILYTTVPPSQRQPPTVLGAGMKKFKKTGVDTQTSTLLTFRRPASGDGGAGEVKMEESHAIATTSFHVSSVPSASTPPSSATENSPSITIFGESGQLQVWGPIHRPTHTRLILSRSEDLPEGRVEERDFSQPVSKALAPLFTFLNSFLLFSN